MLKLSNSLLHYKGEDDDDDGTYKMDVIYDNQIKSLLIINLCTCFELLEKQMSKISVSKIPTKDSIL